VCDRHCGYTAAATDNSPALLQRCEERKRCFGAGIQRWHLLERGELTLHVVCARQVPEITLSAGEDELGFVGAVFFCWGIADLFFDILLCFTLVQCQQWWLFSCSFVTLIVTCVTSIFLGFKFLHTVGISHPGAQQWWLEHGKLATFVVLASSSRLESMAVLRLRICGRTLSSMPMEPRHFHFIRQAGLFHNLIEDIPHALVSIAKLRTEDSCQMDGDWFADSKDVERTVAIVSLVFSVSSIVFGVVNKSMQLLAMNARHR
jgi:hypothetical protein